MGVLGCCSIPRNNQGVRSTPWNCLLILLKTNVKCAEKTVISMRFWCVYFSCLSHSYPCSTTLWSEDLFCLSVPPIKKLFPGPWLRSFYLPLLERRGPDCPLPLTFIYVTLLIFPLHSGPLFENKLYFDKIFPSSLFRNVDDYWTI